MPHPRPVGAVDACPAAGSRFRNPASELAPRSCHRHTGLLPMTGALPETGNLYALLMPGGAPLA